MNWIETLYRTYENCADSVGSKDDRIPLAPIAHTVQKTFIEITLDQFGVLQTVSVSPLITIIPCTEASASRTNSPVAHPLVDKLKYIASDFYELTGEAKPKPSKKEESKNHHSEYRKELSAWANSPHALPSLFAIQKYLDSSKGRVLSDLCKHGVYPQLENKQIPKKWSGEKALFPIYELTKNSPAPWDAFVRWRVTIPSNPEDRTFWDAELWASWINYYLSTSATTGLCFVNGNNVRLASTHPKRIRSIADGAKLISSNDSSGFTFRGRFTDPDGSQACGVSFDVTQKVHNALRWLIAKQGRTDGDQAIVTWSVSGKMLPPVIADSWSLLNEEEDFVPDENTEAQSGLIHAETGQDFALKLKVKIGGYKVDLGSTDQIAILALDSATPGRISITYYREIKSSEFLERLERWHEECSWFQNFGQKRHFIGAPAPKDIAMCSYGTRLGNKGQSQLEDKLLAATYRRLLPCIIECQQLPSDIVESCIRRATARLSMDHWEWEKSLGIACALYRKQQTDLNQHQHPMSLERTRTNRNYLYGRLLAVADHLESAALKSAEEKRDSNAARLMQRFADYPFSTWRTIELSLAPYKQRLKANSPGLLALYVKEMEEIMELFTGDEFTRDEKLTGEFLLAYHTQSKALWTKQSKDTEEKDEEND